MNWAEDGWNNSDSRFDQKVGHFAIRIRRATPKDTSGNTYRNGHTRRNQNSIHTITGTEKPHTFWLIASSLDAGLGDGDDMVKAFDKQTQTTDFALIGASMTGNPPDCGATKAKERHEFHPCAFCQSGSS